MKKNIITFIILISFLAANTPAFAIFGARPMGMGSAFTAIADDATAAYWNPAGLALKPGVDVTGSVLLNNRNDKIGDNMAAAKFCYETEVNPFAWIIGVGAVSLAALEAAKFLSDQGVVKQNWGNDTPKFDKDESLNQAVIEKGQDKTVAVGLKIKEKAKDVSSKAIDATASAVKDAGKSVLQAASNVQVQQTVYWGPIYYPYYSTNYNRPSYWDDRTEHKEHAPQGKAQFAGGLSWVTDKNATLGQDTNWYTFSLATGYEERVSLGGNINLYALQIKAPNGNDIKGYGAGLDLGIIAVPAKGLSLGIAAKEILTTDIKFENGSSLAYKMKVNGGVAITPIKELTVSFDLHNFLRQSGDPQTTHIGVEARPFPGLAFRAGLDDGSKTAGASLMVNSAVIDYAFLGGVYNRTHMLGLTWKF